MNFQKKKKKDKAIKGRKDLYLLCVCVFQLLASWPLLGSGAGLNPDRTHAGQVFQP